MDHPNLLNPDGLPNPDYQPGGMNAHANLPDLHTNVGRVPPLPQKPRITGRMLIGCNWVCGSILLCTLLLVLFFFFFLTDSPFLSIPPNMQHIVCPEPWHSCSDGIPTHAHDPDLSLPGLIKCWVFIWSGTEIPLVLGTQVHPELPKMQLLCLFSAIPISPAFSSPYLACPWVSRAWRVGSTW